MRFRSKALAALSILLILAGAMGGWHATDDRDDDPAQLVHHHGDHNERFTAAGDPGPGHCAFCHWLRTLSNGAPVAAQQVSAAAPTLVKQLAVAQQIQARDHLALPSRAPPVG